MEKELILGTAKKYVIASSCAVLMLAAFLPTLASAKGSELSADEQPIYSQNELELVELESSKIDIGQIGIGQKQLDQLTDLVKQTFVQDEDGNYVFDESKAQTLGFSEEDILKANYYFANVLTQKEIRSLVGVAPADMETMGKASMTAKALASLLTKYAQKIDNAIGSAIDLLPFVTDSNKSAWKKAITTVALVKVLNNFIGVTDTVENLVVRGILTLVPGMPEWVASGIAKTLMMVLPI